MEEEFAETLLSGPNPYKHIPTFLSVVGLIQRRRIERLIPIMQLLWRTEPAREKGWTGCRALPKLKRIYLQPLPALCLVLASMGALEPGPACYSFDHPPGSDESIAPPEFPQKIEDRPTRLAKLSPQLNSLAVLALVGCPDYMDEFREKRAQAYVWGSQWDYYTQTPLEVTRILWEPGSEGRQMRSLQRLAFIPADVEQRLRELLRPW